MVGLVGWLPHAVKAYQSYEVSKVIDWILYVLPIHSLLWDGNWMKPFQRSKCIASIRGSTNILAITPRYIITY